MRARRLRQNEIELYKRLVARGKTVSEFTPNVELSALAVLDGVRVKYRTFGNFTLAELTDGESRTRGLGVAKRNPADKSNPVVGQEVALSRAFQGAD